MRQLLTSEGLAVLRLVQEHAPAAYVAGGALRDAWFGRPIKDIVIFVVGLEGHSSIQYGLEHRGYELTSVAAMQYFADDPTVHSARLFEHPDHLPVNIIWLNTRDALPAALDRFDLGFCQIGTDGHATFTTNQFALDGVDKAMTLTRCESPAQYSRTADRASRLREKYPEFTFVVPEKFKEMTGAAAF